MSTPDIGLPEDVVAYRRTPVFDEVSMPEGLRRHHRTRAGVWGVIQVIEGRLRYSILDPFSESILDPAHPGLVQPEQAHEVEPLGPVRFFVEFHARPAVAEGPASGGDGVHD